LRPSSEANTVMAHSETLDRATSLEPGELDVVVGGYLGGERFASADLLLGKADLGEGGTAIIITASTVVIGAGRGAELSWRKSWTRSWTSRGI